MSTENATTRPWEVKVLPKKDEAIMIYEKGTMANGWVANCGVNRNDAYPKTNLPNAELIVRAVNSHDALVEACKNTVIKLRTTQKAYGMETHFAEMFGMDEELCELEQALKLAKGE